MDISTAKEIIAKYIHSTYTMPSGETKNFYTPAHVAQMPRKEFEEELQIWPVEYMQAVLTLAEAWNFEEYFDLEKHGKTDITEWGCKANRLREVVAFKQTVEGKQRMLRTIVSEPYRTEEKDREEYIKDMAVRVEASGSGRQAQRQTKLNIQRMKYLKALEKSISKGGALRDAYERTLADYYRSVDNLTSNEEALALSERDQEKLRPKALWLASLIMPFFIFVRTVDIILDTFVRNGIDRWEWGESRLGGDFGLIERTTGAALLTSFLVLPSAFYEGGATGFVPLFFKDFFITFIYVAIARNLIGILTDLFSAFLGKFIVEPASKCFEAASENDYQMFDVSREMESLKELEGIIKEREDIIDDLRTIINEDQPYGYVDKFLKSNKNLSLKKLAQLEIDNEKIKKQLAEKSAIQ